MSARSHKIRVGQVVIYAEDTGQGSSALAFLHYWGGSRRTWSGVAEVISDFLAEQQRSANEKGRT